jgi:hypothetical protein
MPGVMTHSAADVLAKMLVDQGLASDPEAATLGPWPAYAEGEPDEPLAPPELIACLGTSSRLFHRTMIDGRYDGMDGVQIKVKGNTHYSGYYKAKLVSEYLSTAVFENVVALGSCRYLVHSITQTSFVDIQGKQVPLTKKSLFFINCLVYLEETAGTNVGLPLKLPIRS